MAEPSTVSRTGLFGRGGDHAPVPLTGVSIDAEVSGFCARVSVAHRYVNRETAPIEAVYVFPLDEGAAVCGFEAVVDGTLVIGEVQERDQAFETYDDALAGGHGAFLLDEERPDVFQASVGNLPPGKEVLVRLTYVVELSIDAGRLRFAIPTTVSPRYAPAEDRAGTGRPDSETLNPPVAWRVPYGLNLAVRLSVPGGISGVESPSHGIAVSLSGGGATVTLAQKEAALDRDFVLSVDADGFRAPRAWLERDEDGRHAVAVAFAPDLPEGPAAAEIVFLVDRSGSMGGTSIEEVRNALQLCLRSMTAGCAFNIIGFGSSYQSLFAESRAYDQASLDAASRHVSAMEADLGGTEILPALQFVLQQPVRPALPRQIVVLTDGEVTNTDAVLALARQHAATARIFTFGIGAGASHHLVRGLARAGRGAAEFIFPGERIEPKVVRQFGRLLSPALGDVQVNWTGGQVAQAPQTLPPLFAGGRLLVYGLPAGENPSAVRLSMSGPSQTLSFDVAIDAAPVAGRTVATLAARARIRELEESGDWLHARGSRQTGRARSAATKEIIELSLRYGLLSRETSFVAVERREHPVPGDIQLRRVPIALTTGWGGEQVQRGTLRIGASAPAAAMDLMSAPTRMLSALADDATALVAEARSSASRMIDAARRRARPAASSGMDALVALQQADGSWKLSAELASALGRNEAEIEAAIPGAGKEIRRVWATALALAWLEVHASGRRGEWGMLAAKASLWISGVKAAPPASESWIERARRFITA